MKQGALPLIPCHTTALGENFSVDSTDDTVVWYCGFQPIRVHPRNDHRTQRLMMAFLHIHGHVPQAKIARALGVHWRTVLAAVNLYRAEGDAGFYKPTVVRGAAVMTPEILEQCRQLIDAGHGREEIANQLGIKKANIDKAIQKKILPPTVQKKTLL